MQPGPDRAALATRIQGFGNVNPPPLEDETGSDLAKKAVGRLGGMVGEEVMLTVEDFREKGAVGAVKDAVADAGDILIDGVSGLIGWIRGDAPEEEESQSAEDANKALSNGPSGAAYGISQASPTGGINAVWVMPDEADPASLAQLAGQQGLVAQQNDPRVPKNIQPYMPSPKASSQVTPQWSQMPAAPGGQFIAPYQPAPSGPAGARPSPFAPVALSGMPGHPGAAVQAARWGPAGYAPGASSASAPSGSTGAKGLVERVAKGDVIIGPDVVKRLVSQCTAAKTTPKQLGGMVSERCRRLYLGLDGGDPVDADAALQRLLALSVALAEQDSELARGAAQEIRTEVSEELISLQSSAKHKDAAQPLLVKLGLIKGAAEPSVDLLGGGSSGSAPAAAGATGASEADLLGGLDAGPAGGDDLLGALSSSAPATLAPATALDPLAPGVSTSPSSLGALAGLSLATPPAPTVGAPGAAVAGGAAAGTLGAGAVLPPEKRSDADPFGFVGGEMYKAGTK